MPRIYKPVEPSENKAVNPALEVKSSKPDKEDNKKKDGKEH